MNARRLLADHDIVLTEAAVLERLRREFSLPLHPLLEHGLLALDEEGQTAIIHIQEAYLKIAREAGLPMLLLSPSWRLSRRRVTEAGAPPEINRTVCQAMRRRIDSLPAGQPPVLLGGLIGCEFDAYRPQEGLATQLARDTHRWQAEELVAAGCDLLIAQTLPALPEAIGITLAMCDTGHDCITSFVIGSDGCLLDGTRLTDAIEACDIASGMRPLGYMVNCAWPGFLGEEWLPESFHSRLIGFQANASSLDHSQLNGADQCLAEDAGDWAQHLYRLHLRYGLKLLGGCCGTGEEHLRALVKSIQTTKGTGSGS